MNQTKRNKNTVSADDDVLMKATVKNYYPIIITLILGSVLPLMDTTMIGVLIPSIREDFGSSVTTLQWITMVYTLSAAVAIPLSAWFVRCKGDRFVWLVGLIIFTLGSLCCGLSVSLRGLILARMVQGIGAGIIITVMQSILLHAIGRTHFKTAMTSIAVPAVIIPIISPIVTSSLLSVVHWHWLFLLNIPIATMAVLLALYYLPNDSKTEATPLDITGFILYGMSIVAVIYGLSSLNYLNNPAQPSILIIGAFLTVALVLPFRFIKHCAIKRSPLINIALFKIPSFRTSCSLLLLSSLCFYTGLFFLPLFFIEQFHYSLFTASILLGINGIGALLSRAYMQALSAKFGVSKTSILSVASVLIGTLPLCLNELANVPWLVSCCMLIRGAGIGLLTLIAMTHAYQDVPSNQVADASAWSRILTMLGASIGAASMTFAQLFSTADSTHFYEHLLIIMILFGVLCFIPAKTL